MTFSELAVTLMIWALTAAGCFFGGRAWIRRRFRPANRQPGRHQKP